MPVKPEKISALSKSIRKTPRGKITAMKQIKSEKDSVAGVALSHPDKILYPDSGTTKQDIADYYSRVREWMLPHVVDRPLALVRCPAGMASKCFFQPQLDRNSPRRPSAK